MGFNKSIYSKVLVIGSGPIVIGQAAEFDYAGTQACKSLREEGIETILVNSNPATIMTDEDIADKVYIEPLTVEVISRIISIEKPDGILPTLGGQTALNLAVDLDESGVLKTYDVDLMGTSIETIKMAEDRELFRKMLVDIAEPVPQSKTVSNIEEAMVLKKEIGMPLVVRPAYTLGGTGGGIVYTEDQFQDIVSNGLSASPIGQVLIEKSLIGWKEIEYEVMRDGADNCITICNMENIDPMGVHTGDSIVVAPSQTLTDKEYQMLRSASIKIIRSLKVEGGCNVQLALKPSDLVAEALDNVAIDDPEYYVIEVNPRVSRSSALASKATGYPIARVAAKIACGKRLDEIDNQVTGTTLASFEPALDYCVVKIPRWPFDKFAEGDRSLGTQMKATGEVMGIERSFEGAFMKAVRSLEITGRSMLWEPPNFDINLSNKPENQIGSLISLGPTDERIWAVMKALRLETQPDELSRQTGIDPWFTRSFARIVHLEKLIMQDELGDKLLRHAKRFGFSDFILGKLSNMKSEAIRNLRISLGIKPVYKMVDTCAGEFEATTSYFYSTYEQENEAMPLPGKKAIVIGSGPIRIGQGIEFDYCSVHAAWALQEQKVKSIMINSNPETVSTDFDTSDRLYFEPLDDESVRDIIDNESDVKDDANDSPTPVVVQFGGQTAINLSQSLDKVNVPILGSSAESIDIASDRHLFEDFLSDIGIPNPPGSSVSNVDDALRVASDVGYPVLVRPSYVLGGRGMEIVQNDNELTKFLTSAMEVASGRDILIDKYFEGREVEVDAVCDGETVVIPGIMEHVERAGVHSGDSLAIYPTQTLSDAEIKTIVDYTEKIALALNTNGLINIQFVVLGGHPYRSFNGKGLDSNFENVDTKVYVLEVNPRSSRTVPFISKVTGVPLVKLAIKSMLGQKLKNNGLVSGLVENQNLVAVKAPVFSMSKLSGVDTYLGPEMKSTGEVMGIDFEFGAAVSKALISSGLNLNRGGGVLLSVADKDKPDLRYLLEDLSKTDCKLFATEGTAKAIAEFGLRVNQIPKKIDEGHPNVLDIIENGSVGAVINTITGDRETLQDGFLIRRAAVEKRIPCFTSIDTARAALAILSQDSNTYNVSSITDYRTG